MEGYLRFRQKCKEWQEAHESLLRKITSFQSQVESMRAKLATAAEDGGALNRSMDPFFVEELFESIQESPPKLEAILQDMYAIYNETRDAQEEGQAIAPCTRRDYIGFIGIELDMYEAEYQHAECLVKLLRFDTPSNVWNTYITSLSTQPFLDIDVICDITEKHNFSYRNRAT
ncbi:Aste57867_14639 [Aphanomyces stellatus]|uniref:Aste57867_14639 protein n=1 Tax=Aphanomyces stellatus TaxID=120398 RepID=A0A485L183_9STRA|nr:hypothetical protein As57867_014584 [Aphanomyces stellatus]VFT91458.1 Aste57867_14639 [Aphanomyces stellatus]